MYSSSYTTKKPLLHTSPLLSPVDLPAPSVVHHLEKLKPRYSTYEGRPSILCHFRAALAVATVAMALRPLSVCPEAAVNA